MISWLLQTAAEFPELAKGSAPAGLLSASELQRMEQLASVKRRSEWLLGHCAAKRLVQRYLQMETGQSPPLDALVIARDSEDNAAPVAIFDGQAVPLDLPVGARWVSGAPLVATPGRKPGQPVPRVSGMRLPISLSISHSGDTAFCALYAASDDAPRDDALLNGIPTGGLVQIGADIERIEPRSEGFLQAYFTPDEMARIVRSPAGQRETLVTATWSAKEAVLKALRLGLSVDTRRVSCLCQLSAGAASHSAGDLEGVDAWSSIHVQCDPALLPEALQRANWPVSDIDLCDCPWNVSGWWRRQEDFVLTLAAWRVGEIETD